jgi:hypothetical protein
MKISRRQFLIASAIATGGIVVGGGGAMYAKLKKTDLFNLYVESTQEVLTLHFGDDVAETILRDTWQEYETLLPEVPYIGGEKNLNAENLLVSAYCLAKYRVLKARGQTTEEVGKIIYEAYETATDLPGWLRGVVGRLKYGKKNQERWSEQAAESQKRQYPGDWVFTFVEGDGEEFDYGLDFTECGICKLYHAQDADELTPYLCLMDDAVSKAFNRGLVRHKTLAEGADVCDFRYKKGRETFVYPLRDGWPPKFLGEET